MLCLALRCCSRGEHCVLAGDKLITGLIGCGARPVLLVSCLIPKGMSAPSTFLGGHGYI